MIVTLPKPNNLFSITETKCVPLPNREVKFTNTNNAVFQLFLINYLSYLRTFYLKKTCKFFSATYATNT
jgi:hypothetical protein